LAIAVAVTLSACERESRPFHGRTSADATGSAGASCNPYAGNAWGVAEGKRLFTQYNCVGCHANGGGGMGPPLMDERWIYGSDDVTVFETIAKGRPNGMPAFGTRVTESQIWMLAAYVQAMSGRLPMDVLPSRADHMRYSTPENARRARPPAREGGS
jgi:cytochrome c oxidase cbb3-type subunit 3